MQDKTEFNFIAFPIILFLAIWAILTGEGKNTKQELAKFYGISKTTLAKWILYFQETVQPEDWNKKRFLTSKEFDQLKTSFGVDKDMVMSKKTLAIATDSNYKVLSLEVLRKLERINISATAWKSCSTFPPVVSAAIVGVM